MRKFEQIWGNPTPQIWPSFKYYRSKNYGDLAFFCFFFLIIPHAKNVFLQPSVLLVKVDPSHLSGSTFVIKLIPLKKKKFFYSQVFSESRRTNPT